MIDLGAGFAARPEVVGAPEKIESARVVFIDKVLLIYGGRSLRRFCNHGHDPGGGDLGEIDLTLPMRDVDDAPERSGPSSRRCFPRRIQTSIPWTARSASRGSTLCQIGLTRAP